MSALNDLSNETAPSPLLDSETADLQHVVESLRRDRLLLEAIHHAQAQFIMAADPHGVFDAFLNSLLALTESEYGFIFEMFYTEGGQPYLCAQALTDISWNDESRKLYQQFVGGTLTFNKLKSLYGAVMETGKPVVANDAAHDPRRAGTPAGHPPLRAFLGLPLISNSREFVGVIGLANRPDGYTDDVIAYLEPMVVACSNLIASRKNDLRRQRAEQALLRAQEQLELRVQERTAELERANLALITEVADREWAELALRERTEELERSNRLMVGREERMIELKNQVNELSKQLDKPEPYDLSFLEQGRGVP